MENLLNIILISGKTGINIALYILLPVTVVMMGFMKLLEAKGVLGFTARILSPLLKVTGIPGIGVFAALQVMLVGAAGPVATLAIMDSGGMDKRRIAAVFAMVLTMSQANVTFPMATAGLNLPVLYTTSIIGGIIAASLTYYIFARNLESESVSEDLNINTNREEKALNIVVSGGMEAINIVFKSIPMLILAICFVNFLKQVQAIHFLEGMLSPVFGLIGISGISVLPVLTKFLAGGSAMMGITFDMLKDGIISVQEFNRIAGFIVNPFDLVGLALLSTAGQRVASVAKPAMMGAFIGITVRGVIHLLIF